LNPINKPNRTEITDGMIREREYMLADLKRLQDHAQRVGTGRLIDWLTD
jgi:hypothetical protein